MSFTTHEPPLVCRLCGSTMITILLTFLSTLLFAQFVPTSLHHAGLTVPSSPVHTLPTTNFQTSSADANMAYFIQATNSTANHVPRLIHALHHPDNVYMIHFDTKVSPQQVHAIMQRTRERTPLAAHNVYTLDQQVVTYAGFSMVINTLSGMDALLKLRQKHPWDFFINLSGSDYPLLHPTMQRQILGTLLADTKDIRRNFFSIDSTADNWDKFHLQRLRNFFVDEVFSDYNTDGRLLNSRVPNPLAISKTVPFKSIKGSAWMIVSHDFVQYSVDSDLSRQLIATLGLMRACDEHFFITLAYNSPRFKPTMIGSNLRKDIWHHEGERSGSHPFVLEEKRPDGNYRFLEMLDNSFSFHARKFAQTDSQLMDIIDKLASDPERQKRVKTQINTVLKESGPDSRKGRFFVPL